MYRFSKIQYLIFNIINIVFHIYTNKILILYIYVRMFCRPTVLRSPTKLKTYSVVTLIETQRVRPNVIIIYIARFETTSYVLLWRVYII